MFCRRIVYHWKHVDSGIWRCDSIAAVAVAPRSVSRLQAHMYLLVGLLVDQVSHKARDLGRFHVGREDVDFPESPNDCLASRTAG